MFYSVRYDYTDGGEKNVGKGVTYKFEVDKDERYAVFVGVKDPWNEKDRFIDIKVNGKLIANGHNTYNTLEVFEAFGIKADNGVITVSSVRDEKSLAAHLDPIISFIVIAKDTYSGVFRSIKLSGTNMALSYSPQKGLGVENYKMQDEQMWSLKYTVYGSYVILAKVPYFNDDKSETPQCLDVANGSREKGAQVITYRENGNANQRWFFEKQEDGSYLIKSENSGLYLTYNNGRFTQEEAGKENQKWVLEVIK